MNNSDSDLIPLPPPSQRVVPGLNIPLSYIQVTPRVVVELRGSLQPPPPSWPATAPQDLDGERTWRVDFTNTTIYIRSQTLLNDPQGHWALSSTGEEIFVHQSLAKFNILYPTAVMPDAPPLISSSGFEHEGVLVLLIWPWQGANLVAAFANYAVPTLTISQRAQASLKHFAVRVHIKMGLTNSLVLGLNPRKTPVTSMNSVKDHSFTHLVVRNKHD
ncbi:hypothetical protein FRB91_007436 [Serendipita sp. 411]|nr:hypothetical protein FRB91_007436 [Serendipita sp. 411]